MATYYFTSESVSPGHPDKICDQISDMLLDKYLKVDPDARTAIETLVTRDKVLVAGEVSSVVPISHEEIRSSIRALLRDIGYTAESGFAWDTVEIEIRLQQQSPDIAIGLVNDGAGDQGMMFGYACDETVTLMPASLHYAHLILQNIFTAIKVGELPGLGPDAKSQVTIRYVDSKPVGVEKVVLSIQHRPNITKEMIREMVMPYLVDTLMADFTADKLLLNPTGSFTLGGPAVDTGLTGRKIIVDTYGGAAPHGGGAFSGKDATKVDRSAAYAARYLAKNIVAAGLASKCTIQISYAIGVSKPVSLYVNTGNTGKVSDAVLTEIIPHILDLSPGSISTVLGLKKPIFQKTATYGHFGRYSDDSAFLWERLDLADRIVSSLTR